MYLDFSNFRGRTSAGGGQALVQKRGQVSDGGGDWQNFRRMGGTPAVPPPQEKNPVHKSINDIGKLRFTACHNLVPILDHSRINFAH